MNGKFLYTTPNFPSLFNFTGKEILNMCVDDLLPGVVAEFHKDLIENAIKYSNINYIFNEQKDFLLRGKTGGIFNIKLYAKSVPNLSFGLIYMVQISKVQDHSYMLILNKEFKINGLTEIDLTSYDFNSDLIQLVISAVKFNGTVQKLILTGNLLGEEGCYWLGMMLRNNTTVNDVDLTRCGITNTCLKMINEGLRSSKHNNSNHTHKVNTFHLEKLRLSDNKITSEGATELANLLENFSYLKWLNITKNTLSNEGFKTLLLKYEELLQMKSSHSTSLETLIAINNQIKMVKLQLYFSDKTAIPYVDMALPMYVQEFNTPDTVDTLPYL
jgi:hypothetical protein